MARTCFHNRIATSQLVLPVSLAAGLILWSVRGGAWLLQGGVWTAVLAVACASVATLVLFEANNRHQLLRVRSRMMSALFWLGLPLVACCPAAGGPDLLPMTLVALALFVLFATYGRRDPVVDAFHCFVLLGVAAVLCVPLAVCVPAFLLYLIIYMRAWSARVCSAALLGLLLVAVCAVLWHRLVAPVVLPQWRWPVPADYPLCGPWLVTAALGLVSAVRYVRQSYDDKIQVRMMFYCIVCQWAVVQFLTLLFPWRLPVLLPLSWFFTATLVAHQMAVSHSRWTSVWLAAVALTVISLYLI